MPDEQQPLGIDGDAAAKLAAPVPPLSGHIRLALGAALLLGYLALGSMLSFRGAWALAVALGVGLHQYAIDETSPTRVADAYLWAAVLLLVAAGLLAVALVGEPAAWMTLAAGRLWLPLGLTGTALALERHWQSRAAATHLGDALARARRRK